MFPIGDDNSDRTITPYVNYAFIGINVLVFLLLQQNGSNEAFSYAFSLVPREIMTGTDIAGGVAITNEAGRVLGRRITLPAHQLAHEHVGQTQALALRQLRRKLLVPPPGRSDVNEFPGLADRIFGGITAMQ